MTYPGIFDFHVHIGETIAGHELADDWHSFSRLYEHQGLEGIGLFVTESEKEELEPKLERMREAAKAYPGKVFWHLTPRNLDPRKLEKVLAPDTDIKLYTTYREAGLFCSFTDIKRFMKDMHSHKTRLLAHCEDDKVVAEFSERYPFIKPSDHALRRPEKAEISAVEKLLDLAIQHHYPLHIVHVSCPQSCALDSGSQKRG